jgi:diguanylate cyclase (GGDEF)-like protein
LEAQAPFSVFLIDVDGISEVSKRYGRSAADFLLAGMATTAAQSLRRTDFIARFDDARWGLILNRADRATAQAIADRVQESVRKKRFSLPEQALRDVSLSMGVAIFPENGRSPEALIESADQALRLGQAVAPGEINFAQVSAPANPPTTNP